MFDSIISESLPELIAAMNIKAQEGWIPHGDVKDVIIECTTGATDADTLEALYEAKTFFYVVLAHVGGR